MLALMLDLKLKIMELVSTYVHCENATNVGVQLCVNVVLNKLIFVNINWPSNPSVGCVKPFDFESTCEVELKLIMSWKLNLKMKLNVMNF